MMTGRSFLVAANLVVSAGLLAGSPATAFDPQPDAPTTVSIGERSLLRTADAGTGVAGNNKSISIDSNRTENTKSGDFVPSQYEKFLGRAGTRTTATTDATRGPNAKLDHASQRLDLLGKSGDGLVKSHYESFLGRSDNNEGTRGQTGTRKLDLSR